MVTEPTRSQIIAKQVILAEIPNLLELQKKLRETPGRPGHDILYNELFRIVSLVVEALAQGGEE